MSSSISILPSTSIQHKLISLLGTIVTITFVFASAILIVIQSRETDEALQQKLDNISQFAQQSLGAALWQYNDRYINDFVHSLFLYEDIVFVQIYEEGKTLVKKSAPRYPEDSSFTDFSQSRGFITAQLPVLFKNKPIGKLHIAITRERIFSSITREIMITCTMLLIVLAAILISVVYTSRTYLFKPLRRLENTAKTIAAGNLEAPIDTSGNDEIGMLAKTFQQMMTNLSKITASRDLLEREIQERKNAEKRLRSSLKEKEILLKEVHHRVKNNLQLIQSLLNLQEREKENGLLASSLEDTRNRISAMALIHENLYRSANVGNINFTHYIETLVGHLIRSHRIPGKEVLTNYSIADIAIPLDVAIPCGLIINELVTNSLKHAFDQTAIPQLSLRLENPNNGEIKLSITDNGRGIGEETLQEETPSLGLKLVRILAEEQLEGTLKISAAEGTATVIQFRFNST